MARSAQSRRGLGLVRRSTATSWRSTSNSMSLVDVVRPSSKSSLKGHSAFQHSPSRGRRPLPEEDQLGQLAGGGDDTDVAAAAGTDLVADVPQAGVRGHAVSGLDRGPPHQAAPLLICGNPERQLAVATDILILLDLLGGG
jgi:hypothetical protein